MTPVEIRKTICCTLYGSQNTEKTEVFNAFA